MWFFDTISRTALNGSGAIRASLLNVFSKVLAGTRVSITPRWVNSIRGGGGWSIAVRPDSDAEYIEFTDADSNRIDYNHIGRVYRSASNIASYQLVIDVDAGIQKNDGTANSAVSAINAGNRC